MKFVKLSGIVALCTLLASIMLYYPPSRPNDFMGLGAAIGLAFALLALGCGNLLCFILNLVACWKGFRRPWFIGILVIQGIIVTICLMWIGSNYLEQYRDRIGREQLDTIRAAIKQDDLQAFFAAKKACGSICSRRTSDHHELFYASQSKAHHIAAWIVGNGVKIPEISGPSWELKTCDGIYLHSVNTLAMAVANEDHEMLAILLPAADSYARYQALELSAKLNRLEMLQWLVAHDIPLDSPYCDSPDQGRSLLEAAAEGAAWDTARWLIDTQGVSVDHDNGGTKGEINSLLWKFIHFFMSTTDSPDAKPFLMLLVEQGINLDARDKDGETSLQWAIRLELANTVRLLLEAGADTQYLNEDQQKALHILLTQEPDNWRHSSPTEGCVKIDRALP